MKSTTYIDEITNQINEKYLRWNPLACSPPGLMSALRKFLCEFTEKCLVDFDQFFDYLFHMVLVIPIFLGFFFYHPFYGMTSRF